MSANTYLRDQAIRHAIYSERFGRGLAKRIVSLLNEADGDLTDKLEGRLSRIVDGQDSGPATTRRLTEIIESLRSINSKVYTRLLTTLQTELVDLADFEMENSAATLAQAVPVSIVSTTPTPAFLKTLVTTTPIDGFLLKPWVDQMATGRLARIEKALRIGMVSGETPQQLATRIRGTKAKGYKDGVLQISRRSAETLALTANSTIANAAREQTYRDNARVISKLKWLSTLDSRTSETCQARDGRLYDLDKPHPTPPAHPRCRSVMIPVTVSFDSLGLDAKEYSPRARASMDGQVPGSTTFGDWLKDQPRDRVVEIMGAERADMFLTGKLPFKDFFNTDDSYLTLNELRAKSNVAKPAAPPKPATKPTPSTSVKDQPTLADVNAGHDADMKAYTLEQGRKNGKEHLAIYDAATGKAFPMVSDNKKSSVEFPPWMVAELQNPTNEIVLHHNHPSSSSFSPADLRIVHEFAGAKGIWAHGHNGSSYYAEAGARKMTPQSYNFIRKWAQQWVQRKVNSKEMTTDDANLLFYHVVTKLVEHRGHVVYRSDLKGETLDAYNRNKTLIETFLASIAGDTP